MRRSGDPKLAPWRSARLLAVAILLAPSCVLGQVGLGVQGGLSLSTFSTRNERSVTTRLGVTAGAFVDVPLTARIVFRPTLAYTQRGGQTRDIYYTGDPPALGTRPVDWRIDHIQFVALFSIDPGPPGTQAGRVLLGGTLARQVRAERLRDDGTTEAIDLRTISPGLTGGLAIELDRARLELRYEIVSAGVEGSYFFHHYGAFQVAHRIR